MDHNFRFAILDGARLYAKLEKALTIEPGNLNLYKGQSQESLAAVAPYIFPCHPFSELEKWIINEGRGLSWGIIVETTADFETAWKHFRKFLLVKTDEGKELYFRFYDPRVLRIFLPTCDAGQLEDFFGPIEKFICADEDPSQMLQFRFNGKDLLTEKKNTIDLFPSVKKIQPAASDKSEMKVDTTIHRDKPGRRIFFE